MPGVVVAFLVVTSIPTTPRPTRAPIGDLRPSYKPAFTIPLVSRDSPYGIPNEIIVGLHSNTSMYENNNATISPPLNPYVVSWLAIRNPG